MPSFFSSTNIAKSLLKCLLQCGVFFMWIYGWISSTNKQTNKETNKQRNEQTNKQTNKQTKTPIKWSYTHLHHAMASSLSGNECFKVDAWYSQCRPKEPPTWPWKRGNRFFKGQKWLFFFFGGEIWKDKFLNTQKTEDWSFCFKGSAFWGDKKKDTVYIIYIWMFPKIGVPPNHP